MTSYISWFSLREAVESDCNIWKRRRKIVAAGSDYLFRSGAYYQLEHKLHVKEMHGMADNGFKSSNTSKNQSKKKVPYQNKHKTPEDARIDGPNRPAE
jgi:hypothetical protein